MEPSVRLPRAVVMAVLLAVLAAPCDASECVDKDLPPAWGGSCSYYAGQSTGEGTTEGTTDFNYCKPCGPDTEQYRAFRANCCYCKENGYGLGQGEWVRACPDDAGVFADKAPLKTAVDEWTTDASAAEATHGAISGWDVSRVDDLSSVFLSKTTFNEPLNWDTSQVTTMEDTFIYAASFNQPLVWDTSKVATMYRTLHHADAFNSELAWDTSSVTNMAWTRPLSCSTGRSTGTRARWRTWYRTFARHGFQPVRHLRLGRLQGVGHGRHVRRLGARLRRVQQARDARGVEGRRRLHERVQLVSRRLPVAAAAAAARRGRRLCRRSRRGALPRYATRASNDSDCTTEQLSTCVADPGCTSSECAAARHWARLRLRGGQTQMVRRQLPAEQLPSNDVHVHPVAASLAAARATAVAAAVAAAVGLAVAAAADDRSSTPSLWDYRPQSPPPPMPQTPGNKPPADPPPPPPLPRVAAGAVVRENLAAVRFRRRSRRVGSAEVPPQGEGQGVLRQPHLLRQQLQHAARPGVAQG